MKAISKSIMQRFVQAAGERLSGNWVIIGGAVLPLSGIEHRVTVDIDIAGPVKSTQAEMLILMEISENLGLPIEAVNQAGAFFLHKIPNWEESLVEIHRGKKATIFRPNVNLFIRLKIARLSEADLEDCLVFLEFARAKGEFIDTKTLQRAIEKHLKNAEGPRADRLLNLSAKLT